jgi:hypothetical protein
MPTYNFAVSTQFTTAEPFGNLLRPIPTSGTTNLANMTWMVNWDGLFGSDALRYNKCVLRYRLVSESSTTLNATTNTGFIGLTGIATDKQAGNFPSTFIGLVTPDASPISSQFRFNLSNLGDFHGYQVNVPRGVGEFGIRFYNDDAMTFQANVTNYIAHFQLHLFNEESE